MYISITALKKLFLIPCRFAPKNWLVLAGFY